MQRNDEQVSEFKEKLVAVNRVSKIVKGGRNIRFSALMVVGDEKGRVGAGMGKAAEIPEAIRKGTEDAKKAHDQRADLTAPPSPTRCVGVFGTGKVMLLPAPEGTGVIAGGPVRAVLEAGGHQATSVTKCYRHQQQDQHGQGDAGGPQAAAQRRGGRQAARQDRRRDSGLRRYDEMKLKSRIKSPPSPA